MKPRHDLQAWLMVCSLALMWGSTPLANKIAIATLSPMAIIAGRLVLGTVVLMIAMRIFALPYTVPRGAWPYLVALSVVGMVVPFYLITWGQAGIDSALAGILMGIMPLVTLVAAHYYAHEPMTRGKTIGFTLGLLGVIVLNGPEALRGIAGGGSEFIYRMAVLGGAVCYAINTILVRRMPPMPSLPVATITTGIAAVMVLPFLFHGMAAPWGSPGTGAIVATVYLGLLPTALATIIYFRVIARAGAGFFSIVNYLSPVVAVVFGYFALGEQLSLTGYVALALILAGIGLATRGKPG